MQVWIIGYWSRVKAKASLWIGNVFCRNSYSINKMIASFFLLTPPAIAAAFMLNSEDDWKTEKFIHIFSDNVENSYLDRCRIDTKPAEYISGVDGIFTPPAEHSALGLAIRGVTEESSEPFYVIRSNKLNGQKIADMDGQKPFQLVSGISGWMATGDVLCPLSSETNKRYSGYSFWRNSENRFREPIEASDQCTAPCRSSTFIRRSSAAAALKRFCSTAYRSRAVGGRAWLMAGGGGSRQAFAMRRLKRGRNLIS